MNDATGMKWGEECTLEHRVWSHVWGRRGIWLGCSRRWILDIDGMGEREMIPPDWLGASSIALGSIE